MSNDTIVTIQGWVGSAPVLREAGGVPVLNVRVGSTPRRLQRSTGTWVDGETQWYSVSAWRRLATHAAESLRQGDAVVVHGRLQHRTWVNKHGVEMLSVEVEAIALGHDLNRGVARFHKAPTAAAGTTPAEGAAQVGAPAHDAEPGAA